LYHFRDKGDIGGRKLRFFIPLAFCVPLGGSRLNIATTFGMKKLDCASKKRETKHVLTSPYNVNV